MFWSVSPSMVFPFGVCGSLGSTLFNSENVKNYSRSLQLIFRFTQKEDNVFVADLVNVNCQNHRSDSTSVSACAMCFGAVFQRRSGNSRHPGYKGLSVSHKHRIAFPPDLPCSQIDAFYLACLHLDRCSLVSGKWARQC